MTSRLRNYRRPFWEVLVVVVISALLTESPIFAQEITPADAKRIIAPRARKVILALRSRNVVRLSLLVHPVKGLRFSPYHYVHVAKNGDRVFTRTQLRTLFTSKMRYVWGEYDPSDNPILLTFAAYYRRFIFDNDYSKAKQLSYNDEMMGGGNLISNIREAYRQAIVVEYHFSGFKAKYGGMDWRSLWLIFETDGSEWYLVGIVHGEWTI